MATKNARDAAPDVAQPVPHRNRASLVEARRMTPGETSQTRRDGLAQEMAKLPNLAGIGDILTGAGPTFTLTGWFQRTRPPASNRAVGLTLETEDKKILAGLHKLICSRPV